METFTVLYGIWQPYCHRKLGPGVTAKPIMGLRIRGFLRSSFYLAQGFIHIDWIDSRVFSNQNCAALYPFIRFDAFPNPVFCFKLCCDYSGGKSICFNGMLHSYIVRTKVLHSFYFCYTPCALRTFFLLCDIVFCILSLRYKLLE